MSDILQYSFMQNALIAGILVSLAAGMIGALIAVNRLVFLTGSIAHSSYGGIGVAIYFSLPIFLGASIFTVAMALLLAWLTLSKHHLSDIYIGMIWAVGMAIGIVFIDLTAGYNVDLMSYLFGSILAVEDSDIWFIAALLIVILLFVHLRYRELLAISYDREYAQLRGIPTARCYTLLLVLSALTVVAAIKVVGLILVLALMTIPTHIVQRRSVTLYSMMIASSLLAMLFTIIGLLFSYYYDLSSGACIILAGAIILIVDALISRLRQSS